MPSRIGALADENERCDGSVKLNTLPAIRLSVMVKTRELGAVCAMNSARDAPQLPPLSLDRCAAKDSGQREPTAIQDGSKQVSTSNERTVSWRHGVAERVQVEGENVWRTVAELDQNPRASQRSGRRRRESVLRRSAAVGRLHAEPEAVLPAAYDELRRPLRIVGRQRLHAEPPLRDVVLAQRR